MFTVGKLIELLKLSDPDEPIVFQFVLTEHTLYTPEEFERIADYLADSDSYGDETARYLKDWCRLATMRMEEEEN